MIFHRVLEHPKQLDLVDFLQRLGVSYHFEDDIRRILKKLCNTSTHDGDVSSFLLIESESIMEEARNFATKHLKEYVNQSNDQNLCARVNHALELPLHWRMPRLEARWFIDAYRSKEDTNSILHGLAKLDFNMAQAVHQEGSKHTGLGDLSFARYRLMENFLWRMGVSFQSRLGYNRRVLTKVNALITTIDDVYDVKRGVGEKLDVGLMGWGRGPVVQWCRRRGGALQMGMRGMAQKAGVGAKQLPQRRRKEKERKRKKKRKGMRKKKRAPAQQTKG
uniref:TPS45 n=1 Tax=Juglans sigillata TaxID=224355 RepID=A0A8K1B0L0_9ROSI|nr:TPS45 [Juglans sigillata]